MTKPAPPLSASSPSSSTEISLPGSTGAVLVKVEASKKDAGAPNNDERSQMTQAQLDEALTLHSPVLLKNLYEAAQRQIAFETGRQGRLDTKAAGLLQSVGLSLTVLTGIGAQAIPKLSGENQKLLLWVSWGVFLVGLFAAGMAIVALRVRKGEYVTVNERTLFAKDLLADADSHEKDKQDEAVTMFYRTMTAHLWEIAQVQERIHDRKALWIWIGQMAFGLFLLGVLGLGWLFLKVSS